MFSSSSFRCFTDVCRLYRRLISIRHYSSSAEKEPKRELMYQKYIREKGKTVFKHKSTEELHLGKPIAEIMAKMSEEERIKLRRLKLAYEILKLHGSEVPDTISDECWVKLMEFEAGSKGFTSLLRLLFNRERKARIKRGQKVDTSTERSNAENEDLDSVIPDRLYLQFYKDSIKIRQEYNLVHSWHFNTHMVLDCGYERMYSSREIEQTAKQILFMLSQNRQKEDPFYMTMCNVDLNRRLATELRRRTNGNLNGLSCEVTDKDFMDLYPKENLVYLTPDSNVNLRYNPNDVYIMGSIVDITTTTKISLAKAKELKLRHAKFPVDAFFKKKSAVVLPFPVLHNILYIFAMTKGDWRAAMKAGIPNRFVEEWY